MKQNLKKFLGSLSGFIFLLTLSLALLLLPHLASISHYVHADVLAYSAQLGSILLPSVVVGYLLSLGFSQQLAEDAFKASVGYILSPELRQELQWIYEQSIVCTFCVCDFRFRLIDDDNVEMELEVYRTLRNEGASTRELPVGVAIDEWASPKGESRIEYLRYKYRGNQYELDESNAILERLPPSTRLDKEENLNLAKGEEVVVSFKAVEYKKTHDDTFLTFNSVTYRPLVKVHYDKTKIGLQAAISHRSQVEPVTDHIQLEGALLQGQHIRIWWWKL